MRLHKRIEPRCRLRVLRHDDGPRGLMIAKQTGGLRFRRVDVLWLILTLPYFGSPSITFHVSCNLETLRNMRNNNLGIGRVI